MQRVRTRRTYAADIVTVALLKLDRTFCIYSRAVFEPDCNMDVGVRQPITTQRASLPNDGPAPATASRRMTALPRATGPSSPTIIAGSFPQQQLSAVERQLATADMMRHWDTLLLSPSVYHRPARIVIVVDC